jgi:hypothetical protein
MSDSINAIHAVPVASLPGEFNLSVTQLSDRRKLLGIKSFPDQNNKRLKYISYDDYQLLCKLDDFIKAGGTGIEFISQNQDTYEFPSTTNQSKEIVAPTSTLAEVPQSFLELVKEIRLLVQKEEKALDSVDEYLLTQEKLKIFADNGFKIPTPLLLKLLKISKIPPDSGGTFSYTFCKHGFTIEFSHQEGNTNMWRIQQ